MNKYEKAFQQWKRYNFNPTDLPDDADECGRIIDEMKNDYDLVADALKKAGDFDLVFSGYVEERGCSGDCKGCDTDDYCPFTIVRGVERMVEFKTESEVMDYYRHLIHIYMLPENDAFDILPHMAMSHGFMAWSMLLYRTFPSFTDKSREEVYNLFADTLFKGTELTQLQQKILREDGWKAYLDD